MTTTTAAANSAVSARRPSGRSEERRMRGRRRKIDTIHTGRFVFLAGPERSPRTSVTAPEQHGYRPARVPSMGHKVITGGRARPSIRYRTLRERDRSRGIGPHIDDCDLAPKELADDLLQRPDVAKPAPVVSPKHEYAFVLAGDGQRSNRPFVAGESECALYGGALAYVEHPPMVIPRGCPESTPEMNNCTRPEASYRASFAAPIQRFPMPLRTL